MVKSALLMQGAWVQFLVEELRSHMPHVETAKKKKEYPAHIPLPDRVSTLWKTLLYPQGNESEKGKKHLNIFRKIVSTPHP